MTDAIHSAVLAACMVSAGAGLLSLLSCGKTLARQMKFLLSLLFAVSLAVPLLHMELPDDLETLVRVTAQEQAEALEERIYEELVQETEQRVRSVLLEKLAAAGITCTELTVTVHRDAENCIHISKVTAVCDAMERANALLPELVGKEAEIVVTQIIDAAS
jgi:hypothetical protein